MSLSTLDLALRAGTTSLLLVLAASLFRDFRGAVAGRLAVAFALGSAAHAVTYGIGATTPVSIWHAPLIALSTGNIVVFWLFTRALFDDTFKMRWWHALLWAAVAGFSFINCAWIAPASGSVRVSIVSAAALYGGINAVLQILVSGREAADVANTANAALLSGIVATICYSMMRVAAGDLLPVAPVVTAVANLPGPSVAPPDSGAADQRLVDALMRLMADERIYRHDNITIGTLATKLRIPEYKLRRLINQRLGYRNFNVFLNNHRIEEAKAALADPSQAEVPVITIAMDAGFQSLGPFNRAFKATTGVTPTEYRRLNEARA